MNDTPETWRWPDGARAAVSLCYDDGNPNNLDQAMPDLEAAGFRGSFYLTLCRGDVQERVDDWRAAHLRGHEIANHTWWHNCRVDLYGVHYSWITRPLEEYTRADMHAEIGRAADWLDENIGIDPDRSFAYPCGHVAIGAPPDRAGYASAVASRHRFGRICANDAVPLNDPALVDLTAIQTFFFNENTPDQFVGAVDKAVASGGWACLGFHGVGGPSHETARETHRAVVDYLARGSVWVAPLKTVAVLIEKHRGSARH